MMTRLSTTDEFASNDSPKVWQTSRAVLLFAALVVSLGEPAVAGDVTPTFKQGDTQVPRSGNVAKYYSDYLSKRIRSAKSDQDVYAIDTFIVRVGNDDTLFETAVTFARHDGSLFVLDVSSGATRRFVAAASVIRNNNAQAALHTVGTAVDPELASQIKLGNARLIHKAATKP